MSLAPGLTLCPRAPVLSQPSLPNVVALGGTMTDEVIGFVQGLLLEVVGAVSILRNDQYIVLQNKTWSPLQGPSRGNVDRACGLEQVMVPPPKSG